jgi:hypothetical protein
MRFFRSHIRNINKFFITEYIEKDLIDKKDDLSDRDYSKTLHILDIHDLLDQMKFILNRVFIFEKSFFSLDLSLVNKNELKYELDYGSKDIIDSSSKRMGIITQFPIKNENTTLFEKDSVDLIRVIL